MKPRSAPVDSGASAPVVVGKGKGDEAQVRFRIACWLLRDGGHFDGMQLPGQRRGESPIDWMVRTGLAVGPREAAEALIVARGLTRALDETAAWSEVADHFSY